jgi:transcriptional regulator with XRE-family HTH domain
MDLANRITTARKALGLTSSELARRARIAQATLHDLESGKSQSARSTTLTRLAEVLGQSPDWLIRGTGGPPMRTAPSKEEEDLLQAFRSLTVTERKLVIRMVRALAIDK